MSDGLFPADVARAVEAFVKPTEGVRVALVESLPFSDPIVRSLVHFAPDGFLVMDHARVIVFANAQAEPSSATRGKS